MLKHELKLYYRQLDRFLKLIDYLAMLYKYYAANNKYALQEVLNQLLENVILFPKDSSATIIIKITL